MRVNKTATILWALSSLGSLCSECRCQRRNVDKARSLTRL